MLTDDTRFTGSPPSDMTPEASILLQPAMHAIGIQFPAERLLYLNVPNNYGVPVPGNAGTKLDRAASFQI